MKIKIGIEKNGQIYEGHYEYFNKLFLLTVYYNDNKKSIQESCYDSVYDTAIKLLEELVDEQ